MELINIENNSSPQNMEYIQRINNSIMRKKPVVIYFYMEGCPHCITTTDEWNQIPQHINKNKIDEDLLAIRINHILFDLLKDVGEQPKLLPNIRYVHGNTISQYNKEGIHRNAHDLSRWIEEKKRTPENSILYIEDTKVEPTHDEDIFKSNLYKLYHKVKHHRSSLKRNSRTPRRSSRTSSRTPTRTSSRTPTRTPSRSPSRSPTRTPTRSSYRSPRNSSRRSSRRSYRSPRNLSRSNMSPFDLISRSRPPYETVYPNI